MTPTNSPSSLSPSYNVFSRDVNPLPAPSVPEVEIPVIFEKLVDLTRIEGNPLLGLYIQSRIYNEVLEHQHRNQFRVYRMVEEDATQLNHLRKFLTDDITANSSRILQEVSNGVDALLQGIGNIESLEATHAVWAPAAIVLTPYMLLVRHMSELGNIKKMFKDIPQVVSLIADRIAFYEKCLASCADIEHIEKMLTLESSYKADMNADRTEGIMGQAWKATAAIGDVIGRINRLSQILGSLPQNQVDLLMKAIKIDGVEGVAFPSAWIEGSATDVFEDIEKCWTALEKNTAEMSVETQILFDSFKAAMQEIRTVAQAAKAAHASVYDSCAGHRTA